MPTCCGQAGCAEALLQPPPAPGLLPGLTAESVAETSLHCPPQSAADDGASTNHQITDQLRAGGVGKLRVQAGVHPAALPALPLAGSVRRCVDCLRAGEQAPPLRQPAIVVQIGGCNVQPESLAVADSQVEALTRTMAGTVQHRKPDSHCQRCMVRRHCHAGVGLLPGGIQIIVETAS